VLGNLDAVIFREGIYIVFFRDFSSWSARFGWRVIWPMCFACQRREEVTHVLWTLFSGRGKRRKTVQSTVPYEQWGLAIETKISTTERRFHTP